MKFGLRLLETVKAVGDNRLYVGTRGTVPLVRTVEPGLLVDMRHTLNL